eukprot:s535_g4.t2
MSRWPFVCGALLLAWLGTATGEEDPIGSCEMLAGNWECSDAVSEAKLSEVRLLQTSLQLEKVNRSPGASAKPLEEEISQLLHPHNKSNGTRHALQRPSVAVLLSEQMFTTAWTVGSSLLSSEKSEDAGIRQIRHWLETPPSKEVGRVIGITASILLLLFCYWITTLKDVPPMLREKGDEQVKDLPPISQEELQKHSHQGDLWVCVDGVVANLTEFATSHPGGVDLLLQHGGGDASEPFHDVGHSGFAVDQLKKHAVGMLALPQSPQAGEGTGAIAVERDTVASRIFTKEDPYNVHKVLGFTVLSLYLYRIFVWICQLQGPDSDWAGFRPDFWALASVLTVEALQLSSFIFHVPKNRPLSGPMIWQECQPRLAMPRSGPRRASKSPRFPPLWSPRPRNLPAALGKAEEGAPATSQPDFLGAMERQALSGRLVDVLQEPAKQQAAIDFAGSCLMSLALWHRFGSADFAEALGWLERTDYAAMVATLPTRAVEAAITLWKSGLHAAGADTMQQRSVRQVELQAWGMGNDRREAEDELRAAEDAAKLTSSAQHLQALKDCRARRAQEAGEVLVRKAYEIWFSLAAWRLAVDLLTITPLTENAGPVTWYGDYGAFLRKRYLEKHRAPAGSCSRTPPWVAEVPSKPRGRPATARAHNLIFVSRLVFVFLCAWTVNRYNAMAGWPLWAMMTLCQLSVFAQMRLADLATAWLRDDTHETLVSTMPYWEHCPKWVESMFRTWYSASQIYTTVTIILAGPGMDLYFVMILPYQLYSVLMTFVRKGVISSRTCHVTYFWSLWQSWICGFMLRSPRFFIQMQFLQILIYCTRVYGLNKYVLWIGLCIPVQFSLYATWPTRSGSEMLDYPTTSVMVLMWLFLGLGLKFFTSTPLFDSRHARYVEARPKRLILRSREKVSSSLYHLKFDFPWFFRWQGYSSGLQPGQHVKLLCKNASQGLKLWNGHSNLEVSVEHLSRSYTPINSSKEPTVDFIERNLIPRFLSSNFPKVYFCLARGIGVPEDQTRKSFNHRLEWHENTLGKCYAQLP